MAVEKLASATCVTFTQACQASEGAAYPAPAVSGPRTSAGVRLHKRTSRSLSRVVLAISSLRSGELQTEKSQSDLGQPQGHEAYVGPVMPETSDKEAIIDIRPLHVLLLGAGVLGSGGSRSMVSLQPAVACRSVLRSRRSHSSQKQHLVRFTQESC